MSIIEFIIYILACMLVAYIRGTEEIYTHKDGSQLMPRWVWFTKIDKYHFWTDLEYASLIVLFTWFGSMVNDIWQAIIGIFIYTTIDFIIYPGVLHVALYKEGTVWQKFWSTSNSNNSSISDAWWVKVGLFVVVFTVSLFILI